MKHPKFIWFSILLSILNLSVGSLDAAIKYWDINGTTAGSGQGIANGTWNTTGTLWTTDATGSSSATTFATGDTAVFSAGTDATNAFAIKPS